jgi:putative restriction endonuclease
MVGGVLESPGFGPVEVGGALQSAPVGGAFESPLVGAFGGMVELPPVVGRTPSPLTLKTSDNIPRVAALRSPDVRAAFSPDVQTALATDTKLVTQLAGAILTEHFPESYHEDLFDTVWLALETGVTEDRKRDPAFRHRVLKAYEYRCAVCRFDVSLGSVSIALDAAHIRWHQANGPDDETNGLALCVLHHKTFDLGAFTVADGVLLVSDQANGSAGFAETLVS